MSAPDTSCYDYVVGLYQGDCDCLNGRPADYNVSDSGLYLSDLLEPKMIDGLLNCDQGDSVWELMDDVRDLAIRYFIADSNALLMKGNKLRRQPYYGGIGLSTYTRSLSIANGYYAGVKMGFPLIRGGFINIKKIGLIFDTTVNINLLVYNRNGVLLHTIPLSATANTHTVNDITDITLPLYDDYLDCIEYYFIYVVNGFEPKNNGFCCSCDKTIPCWGTYIYHNKRPWSHWMNIGGYTGSALPDFMLQEGVSSNMNGLTFNVEIGCTVGEVFCEDGLDFQGNTLAQAMAIAIQKLSGALFVDKIMTSMNLNRAVMIDREQLQKSKEEWKASYNEMIAYITDNIDITANDCFECRDIIEMIQGGIFS